MKRHELTLRAAERVRKAARAHDARLLREAGASRADVARHFGVDVSTVTRWTQKGATP